MVVVQETEVSGLLAFLGDVKVRFSQLALYVERPQTEVIFL